MNWFAIDSLQLQFGVLILGLASYTVFMYMYPLPENVLAYNVVKTEEPTYPSTHPPTYRENSWHFQDLMSARSSQINISN